MLTRCICATSAVQFLADEGKANHQLYHSRQKQVYQTL